jgi:hypothetical protein
MPESFELLGSAFLILAKSMERRVLVQPPTFTAVDCLMAGRSLF